MREGISLASSLNWVKKQRQIYSRRWIRGSGRHCIPTTCLTDDWTRVANCIAGCGYPFKPSLFLYFRPMILSPCLAQNTTDITAWYIHYQRILYCSQLVVQLNCRFGLLNSAYTIHTHRHQRDERSSNLHVFMDVSTRCTWSGPLLALYLGLGQWIILLLYVLHKRRVVEAPYVSAVFFFVVILFYAFCWISTGLVCSCMHSIQQVKVQQPCLVCCSAQETWLGFPDWLKPCIMWCDGAQAFSTPIYKTCI